MAYETTPGFGNAGGKQYFGLSDAGIVTPLVDNTSGIGTQALRFPVNGFLPSTIMGNTAAGSALASSTAATDILGAAIYGTKTVAAGNLNSIGRMLEFEFYGIIANTSTPNITVELVLGTTAILTTGVIATAAITGTQGFIFRGAVWCVTTGATGTVNGGGLFTYSLDKLISAPPVSGAAVTLDLTAAQALKMRVTWGTSSSSNTITCTGGIIRLQTTNA